MAETTANTQQEAAQSQKALAEEEFTLYSEAAEKQRREAQRKKNIRLILLYSLFALTAVVLVMVFPSEVKFKYSYEVGKPWGYESLTSPVKFPILKSAKELEHDYNALLQQYYMPVFRLESKTCAGQEQRLVQETARQKEQFGAAYQDYLRHELRKAYARGILANDDYDEIVRIGCAKMKIQQGGKKDAYKEAPAKSAYTLKSAYEAILSHAPHELDRKALQSFNFGRYIKPNLVAMKSLSEKEKDEIGKILSTTKGMVQDGQKIIDKGEIVDDRKGELLESLKREIETGKARYENQQLVNTGQFACIICVLTTFFFYLTVFRPRFLTVRNLVFILGLITCVCMLSSHMIQQSYEFRSFSVYIVPYTLVPITISTFFDTRTALFTHLTTVLICSVIAPQQYEFLLLQVVMGMICISTLKKFYQRSQLFVCAGITTLMYMATYCGLALTHNSSWDVKDAITIGSFAINGVLVLFAYPLIFIIEKMFGFTSDITLVELTNSNSPLLRQFSELAPGSFQHSMQVSNLASYAANSIGANALLARAGAMYHDIGKMANPVFFTENQNGYNPHSSLDALESVRIITGHVTNGLEIANHNNLPAKIKDFIASHHGRNVVRYFYNTYCNSHPDEDVDIDKFCYHGSLPSTKETAIVMMCDAVEAASRSLSSYNAESISKLVDGIVGVQLKEGAFANAPITISEIECVKEVMKEKLMNIYHTRVRYPELKAKKEAQKEAQGQSHAAQ